MMFSHHLLQAITVFFMITSLVSGRPCSSVVLASAKKQCEQSGRGTHIVYTTATECHICCLCPAGSRKVQDCEYGSPGTTMCEACEYDPEDSNNQTYTPTENYSPHCMISANETLCLELQNTQYIRGTRTQASRCECEDGFYSSSDIMKHGCNQHSPCEPGYYPAFLANSSSNTRCEPCPPGSFSNVSSPTEMCMPFSVCDSDQIIVQHGTSKMDVICSAKNETLPLNQTTDSDVSNTITHNPNGTSSSSNATFTENDNGPTIAIILSSVIGGSALFFGLVIFCFFRWKAVIRRRQRNPGHQHGSSSEPEQVHYTSEDVEGNETDIFLNGSSTDQDDQGRTVPNITKKLKNIIIRRISESVHDNESNEAENDTLITQSQLKSQADEQVHIKQDDITQQHEKPFQPNLATMQEQDSTDVEALNLRNKECINMASSSESGKTSVSEDLEEVSSSDGCSSESRNDVENCATENSSPAFPAFLRQNEEVLHTEQEIENQQHSETAVARSIRKASDSNETVRYDASLYGDDLKLFEYKQDREIIFTQVHPDTFCEALKSKTCLNEMLYGADGIQENVRTACLKNFIRQNGLVKENDIENVETVHFRDQNEMRAQLLMKIGHTQSIKLSPRTLLIKSLKFSERVMYDQLCKAFMSHIQ